MPQQPVPPHDHTRFSRGGKLKTTAITGLTTTPAAATSGGSVTDHGGLAGLGDADHPQYVLGSLLTTRGDLFRRGASAIERVGLGTSGYVLASNGTDAVWAADNDQLTVVLGSTGSALTTGVKGYRDVQFACTITMVEMLADVSGSVVVDIWKDSYANYPPVDADSITAAAVPTISTAQKMQDSTLTGWTLALAAGDILGYNVDSVTTIAQVTVTLKVRRT